MRAELYIEIITQLAARPDGVMGFGGDLIKKEAIQIATGNGDFHRMGFDICFSDDYNRIKKSPIDGFIKHRLK